MSESIPVAFELLLVEIEATRASDISRDKAGFTLVFRIIHKFGVPIECCSEKQSFVLLDREVRQGRVQPIHID